MNRTESTKRLTTDKEFSKIFCGMKRSEEAKANMRGPRLKTLNKKKPGIIEPINITQKKSPLSNITHKGKRT